MAADEVRSALIVATNEYQDVGLRELRAPAHDAQELARVLGDGAIGNFEVNTLINQPQYLVMEQLEAFFCDRRRDDLLLLYFSCHGVMNDGGRLHFAAANTRRNRLASTAISADWVTQQMDRSRSNRVVLMLDCCYSGAFTRGMKGDSDVGVKERFDGRGRVILTASNAIEYSFEGDEVSGTGQPSVFTGALVRGLESGEADRGGDGLIDVDELYDYVYGQVREATPAQTPCKWVLGVEGELYLARSRAALTPKPLPPELPQAIESPFSSVREGAVKTLSQLVTGSHGGLSLSARDVLQRMADDDDSRRVSRAAAAVLVGIQAGGGPTESPTDRLSDDVRIPSTDPEVDGHRSAGQISAADPGPADGAAGTGRRSRSRSVVRWMATLMAIVALLAVVLAAVMSRRAVVRVVISHRAVVAAPALVIIIVAVIARRRRSRPAVAGRTPTPASQRLRDPIGAAETQVPNFQVVALGVAGSGKTVFLASMFNDLSVQRLGRSYFLDSDVRQRIALSSVFSQVASVTEPWPRGTQIGETREFTFDFAAFHEGAKHRIMRINYLDYAGELLDTEQEAGSTALATLENHINGAHSLLGMIDGQRILQCLRDEPAGREYLQHTIQPMIGVMASATCPIQFIITKWDIVHDFGEPEGADDNARLKLVRRALLTNTQIEALVTGRSRGDRMVRLIPVSAIGPGFAEIDSSARVVKSGRSELTPSNLDIPLSAVLPDYFTKVRSELDAPVRQQIEDRKKAMSKLTSKERLAAMTKFVRLPAGIALRSTLSSAFGPSQADSLVRAFFAWTSQPFDTKVSAMRDASTAAEAQLSVEERLRYDIVKEFDFTLWQFEKQCPSSVLIDA